MRKVRWTDKNFTVSTKENPGYFVKAEMNSRFCIHFVTKLESNWKERSIEFSHAFQCFRAHCRHR